MTRQELKQVIDTEITNKIQKNSITPVILGSTLKIMTDNLLVEGEGGGIKAEDLGSSLYISEEDDKVYAGADVSNYIAEMDLGEGTIVEQRIVSPSTILTLNPENPEYTKTTHIGVTKGVVDYGGQSIEVESVSINSAGFGGVTIKSGSGGIIIGDSDSYQIIDILSKGQINISGGVQGQTTVTGSSFFVESSSIGIGTINSTSNQGGRLTINKGSNQDSVKLKSANDLSVEAIDELKIEIRSSSNENYNGTIEIGGSLRKYNGSFRDVPNIYLRTQHKGINSSGEPGEILLQSTDPITSGPNQGTRPETQVGINKSQEIVLEHRTPSGDNEGPNIGLKIPHHHRRGDDPEKSIQVYGTGAKIEYIEGMPNTVTDNTLPTVEYIRDVMMQTLQSELDTLTTQYDDLLARIEALEA